MDETPVTDQTPVEPVILERNPVTHQRHHDEVLRQITIPLVIGRVVILTLCVLVGVGSAAGEHARWAGISLIWLIVPTMLFAFIFLALLAGLIYLVTMMFVRLPLFARKVQDFFLLVKHYVAQVDDKLVEPILRMRSTKASADSLARNLAGKEHRQ